MKDRAVHMLAFAPHPHNTDGTICRTVARRTWEGKDVGGIRYKWGVER